MRTLMPWRLTLARASNTASVPNCSERRCRRAFQCNNMNVAKTAVKPPLYSTINCRASSADSPDEIPAPDPNSDPLIKRVDMNFIG